MKIGNLEIKGFAALAPMAGVADRAMREICMRRGAAFCVGELTSSRGITLGDSKSKELLYCGGAERPMAPQLFGCEPDIMAEAARAAMEFSPDFIDINMGCPAPKVVNNGGGSSLLRDIKTAEKIVKAVVSAVTVPVTVKIRTGWDENSIVAPDYARMCEASGVSAVTIHGRTRAQMYAPGVDYKTIADTVKAVKIPIIANGDITDGKSAKHMYDVTGCAFLSVGRAARGNPFVFEEINAFMQNREYTHAGIEEKFSLLIEQIELMQKYKGGKKAVLEARKHTAWYMQGLKGAAQLRVMCGKINTIEDIREICRKAIELQTGL